jgi:hypothetical protein
MTPGLPQAVGGPQKIALSFKGFTRAHPAERLGAWVALLFGTRLASRREFNRE